MPTAQDPNITTNQQITDTHTQNVTDNLNQAGHPVQATDVKPTTSETPIQKTEELIAAGAQVIGEDLKESLNDLGYIAEADIKHGDKTRTTQSKNPLKMLVGKLMRKKKISEEVVEK